MATKSHNWGQLAVGALIILAALVALVYSLVVLLDHFPANAVASTANGNNTDTAGSIVAVLTPLATAITAIVGLYFGISASGSTRGQNAQTAQTMADTSAKAVAEAASAHQQTLKALDALPEGKGEQLGIIQTE